MRVLVVEDEQIDREILVAALQQLGHDVVAVEGGRPAWAVFHQEQDIPLVISDWLMPDLDGLELCRLVRGEERPQYTYIILITILSGKRSYLRAMEAGADDFISKPLDPDDLAARLRVVSRILELRRHADQLEKLLPICSYCKSIRDEAGTWWPLEEYMARRVATGVVHSVCPRCGATTESGPHRHEQPVRQVRYTQ